MDLIALAAFAFLAGLAACGTAATLLELLAKREIRFAEPFVSPSNLPRSVAAALLAGPFMLGNDALAAWRSGDITASTLVFCTLASALWLTATGVVVLALASGAAGLLG